ncbi:hypothetical protein Bca101_030938 [Brassica carinata]
MWFRDKREKEQQRLCNIQRDDDAVHRRIMKCMRDYKSKEETIAPLKTYLLASCYSEREDISGGRVVIKVSYFGFHVPIFMTSVMRHAV